MLPAALIQGFFIRPYPRPLAAQTQRLSDAIEAAINPYLNNQISLDKAVNEAQQKIDQIQRMS